VKNWALIVHWAFGEDPQWGDNADAVVYGGGHRDSPSASVWFVPGTWAHDT
jgi:hypothetical protein